MDRSFLVGDVSATRSVLAIATDDAGTVTIADEATYDSADFASLEEMVRAFLDGRGRPAGACFSVAGPVVDDQVWFPHHRWSVDGRRLREATGLHNVQLVNDMQATAMAVPYLGPKQAAILQMGVADPRGVRAIVAAGAGLGEATLIPDGAGWRALPSEGGHADFAPNNSLQEELLTFLRHDLGHVSYEQVCSVSGIANIYRFLREAAAAPEPAWLTEQLEDAEEPGPIILAAALNEATPSPGCRQALEVFASILGAEAGNLALRTLSNGGVYVGGDLPAKLLPVLRGGAFLAAFRNKGAMSDIIRRIPVHVVLEPRAAMYGAARYALAAAPAHDAVPA